MLHRIKIVDGQTVMHGDWNPEPAAWRNYEPEFSSEGQSVLAASRLSRSKFCAEWFCQCWGRMVRSKTVQGSWGKKRVKSQYVSSGGHGSFHLSCFHVELFLIALAALLTPPPPKWFWAPPAPGVSAAVERSSSLCCWDCLLLMLGRVFILKTCRRTYRQSWISNTQC